MNTLLLALGIKLIISSNVSKDCYQPAYDRYLQGCYYQSTIVVSDKANNATSTVYHELGHHLFLGNEKLRQMVAKMDHVKYYGTGEDGYYTKSQMIDESVADYFAWFMNDKWFFYKLFPELAMEFNKWVK